MADHFFGKNHNVHFSNGLGKALMQSLITFSKSQKPDSRWQAAERLLEEHANKGSLTLEKYYSDYDPAFENEALLKEFLELVAIFGQDLAKNHFETGYKEVGLKIRMLSKLRQFYDILAFKLEEKGLKIKALNLELEAGEQEECLKYQLSDELAEMTRRGNEYGVTEKEKGDYRQYKLKRLEEWENQFEMLGVQEGVWWEKAWVLEHEGRYRDAALELRKYLEYATQEEKAELVETIETLEKEENMGGI